MQDPQQAVHLVATAIGYGALVMLWAGLTLGIVLRDGWAVERIRPATLAALHQTATACGLTLVIVHALTQLAVPDGPTRTVDLVIPFLHHTHPIGVGLGLLALDMMIALGGSVLLRRRLGYHKWRVLHRAGYLAFALLIGHVVVVGAARRSIVLLAVVAALGIATITVGLFTAGWVSRLPDRVGDLLSAERRRRKVSIQVDATRCVHFGFCQHEAPDLFEVREDGRLGHSPTARIDQVDAAIRAARACPTRAIVLSRRAVRVVLGEPPEGVDTPPSDNHADTGDGSAAHAGA
jgi:sulfoxide reductase heme-binding subunit YedZ